MILSEYLDLFPIILIFAHVSCFFLDMDNEDDESESDNEVVEEE